MRRLLVVAILVGGVGAMVSTGVGCTDASLRKEPPEAEEPPEPSLDVRGRYCTEPSETISFPVKVLYVLDRSASLCCTDNSELRRDAVENSMQQLRGQATFGILSFTSEFRKSWGDEPNFQGNPSEVIDSAYFENLGNATDYQGALAETLRTLEEDIRGLDPPERARTRYVVNFISDGVPRPQCKQGCEDGTRTCDDGKDNDGDGQIDADDPDCAPVYEETDEQPDRSPVCNTTQEIPEGQYVDFAGGCDALNQPPQVTDRVRDIVELEEEFRVGDIRMNTILLSTDNLFEGGGCALTCSAFEPNYNPEKAVGLLQEMAETGGGRYRRVDVESAGEDFLNFNISTRRAEQSLATFVADNRHAAWTGESYEPDADADGLADSFEEREGLDPRSVDSDGDGYRDLFEQRLSDEGFAPGDADQPARACESTLESHGDNDLLLDCEEEVVGTNPGQADTDGDGMTDWFEVVGGTKPQEQDTEEDADFDGIANLDELLAGTDPGTPDAAHFRDVRTTYAIEDRGREEVEGSDRTRRCYDYRVRNVPLVTTQIDGNRGLNRVVLEANEQPAEVAGVPGRTKLACIEARYDEGGIKQPADGVVELTPGALKERRREIALELGEVASCPQLDRESFGRQQLRNLAVDCLPERIELRGRLFDREELLALTNRQLQGNLEPKLPEAPRKLFSHNFSGRHPRCYQPWEIARLNAFLGRIAETCRTCARSGMDASVGDAAP